MLLGLVSDLHLGYTRGHKTMPNGCNVREYDVYKAARQAISNLVDAGVDAILDLGDIANVPNPKKRALINLIDLINSTGLDWYSCNGNHTLQRTASDAHLYDLLKTQCPRFHGVYAGPAYIPAIGAYLVPYDVSRRVEDALRVIPTEATLIGGHWACDDADWPGEHVDRKHIPDNIPVFLGHWHTRSIRGVSEIGFAGRIRNPIYIGATERFAWGEAENPTGVATYDTERQVLTFIDHPTRPWVDVRVTPDNYLEDRHYENVQGAITRVHITASPEQYNSLDLVSVRKKLASSMEFQVLRSGLIKTNASTERRASSFSISDQWRDQLKRARMPKGIKREDVERVGLEVLGEQ
jgi:DNA repair exonuclease SbcCD nuclease subunit